MTVTSMLAGRSLPFAASPDAELLALGERLKVNRQRCDALIDPWYDAAGGCPQEVYIQMRPLRAEYAQLVTAIGECTATTIQGLRVKAAAAMEQFDLAIGADVRPDEDGFLAWSLCRDLLQTS
jgi:hypothetical protein